tara:strand:+ start:561 stop:1634 length:1074 start_codon:yes stop_codon:yes gene_type:complete
MQKNKKGFITFAQSINKALHQAMIKDKKLFCYGLGINDEKGVFGTTLGLNNKFGNDRVFDIPCSENALTGISVGAALNGYKSVATHQRLDFFLLAMDQLVNAASKWHYLYGPKKSVSITIRLIIGRGWGQGPTHSQSLHSWFNHIPGLKIVMPTFPSDAEVLLQESIKDPNPVIFIEHRWLHGISEKIKNKDKKIKIGKAKVCIKGNDVTIIASSYLTLEAIEASKYLKKNFKINCEIIDLRTIKPLDIKTILKSVKKTRRVLILDSGHETGSIANDIMRHIISKQFKNLKIAPQILAMPNVPQPASQALIKNFFKSAKDIALEILKIMKRKKTKDISKHFFIKNHDQPNETFKGPF